MSPHTLHRGISRRSRKGAALAISLFLIVVLSATAAAALSMVGSERRFVDDQEAAAEAHAMARSAYDQFMANPVVALAGFAPPTWTGPDSVYYAFSDGYAWVRVQRIRPAVLDTAAIYLVRSRAVRTIERPVLTPVAERAFAQYATWDEGTMSANAAWLSLSGLQKTGGAGTLSGTDNCGGTPVAGVAVPNVPGYTQAGGTSVPVGSPPILNMGTQAQANAAVTINWAGIVGGTALAPAVKFPGGSWPSFSDPNYWPIIYVDQAGDWSLPGDGRGTLVVRNNLTLGGSVQWRGIILVGGTLTSNGNNTVNGTVVTGLNVLLGQSVPASSLGNGSKTFQYNSCDVAAAANSFGGLAPLRNTSADNWPSY